MKLFKITDMKKFVSLVLAIFICSPQSVDAVECLSECSIAANDILAGRNVNFTALQQNCPVLKASTLFAGSGSKNQVPICMAAFYLGNQDPIGPITRSQWWVEYFNEQLKPTVGFMSDEIFSPLYASPVAGAVFAVYNRAKNSGDSAVATRAERWLKAFWASTSLVARPGSLNPLTTHLYNASKNVGDPLRTQEVGSNTGSMGGLTVATAGARQRGWGRGGPHIGHVSLIHPMLSAALAAPNRKFNGKIYPPQSNPCWNQNERCSIGYNGGMALFAQTIINDPRTNWNFDSQGRISGFASNVPADLFGLTNSERQNLLRLAQNTSDQHLNSALQMLSQYELVCPMSFVRTNTTVGSWFGGDGLDQAVETCNHNKGPFFAFLYNSVTDAGTVLAPEHATNAATWESFRTADNQICAEYKSGGFQNGTGPGNQPIPAIYPEDLQKRCVSGPGGEVVYQLYWDQTGISRVDEDGGGGDDVNCNSPATPEYAYKILNVSNLGHPAELQCGQAATTVSIEVQNIGRKAWRNTDTDPRGNYRFGIHGQANSFNAGDDEHPFSHVPRASELPFNIPIACGDTHTFTWNLNKLTGLSPGNHKIYLGMLKEEYFWFRQGLPPAQWDSATIHVPALDAVIEVDGPDNGLQCGGDNYNGSVTITNRGASQWGAASQEVYLNVLDALENVIVQDYMNVPLPSLSCGESEIWPATFRPVDIAGDQQTFHTTWQVMDGPFSGSLTEDDPLTDDPPPRRLATLGYAVTVRCSDGDVGDACSSDADCNGGLLCNTQTNQCEVPPPDLCPITPDPTLARIVDDTVELRPVETMLVDVLANDIDPSGIPLEIASVSGACANAVNVLPDGTMLSLNPAAISADCSLQYRVNYMCGGSAGMGTLNIAVGGIISDPVRIVEQPQSVTVEEGANAIFRVVAENAFSYQWLEGDTELSGATGSTFTLSTVVSSDDGRRFKVRVCAANISDCVVSDTATLTVNSELVVPQAPFSGQPVAVDAVLATRVEAEDFDIGGNGVSYQESDTVNTPNSYRNESAVEVRELADASNGWHVHPMLEGEWLEYAIDAPPGEYYVGARWRDGGDVAISVFEGSAFDPAAPGVSTIAESLQPPTAPVAFYAEAPIIVPDAAGGTLTLRFEHRQSQPDLWPIKLDYLVMRAKCGAPRTPFTGRPLNVPLNGSLRIEAEHYDTGCNAYFDSSMNQNANTTFRNEHDVDLLTADFPDFSETVLHRTAVGEHVSYTFNAAEGVADYDITLRFLGNDGNTDPRLSARILSAQGQLVHVFPEILDVTGDALTLPTVQLTQEQYVLEISTVSRGHKLNKIDITSTDASCALPRVTNQPTSLLSVLEGETAIFSVGVANSDVTKWYKEPNQQDSIHTGTQLFLSDVGPSHVGQYYAILSNDCGSVESARGTLDVVSVDNLQANPDALAFDNVDTFYRISAGYVLQNDQPDHAVVHVQSSWEPSQGTLQWVDGGVIPDEYYWRLYPPVFYDGNPIVFNYQAKIGDDTLSNETTVTVQAPRHPLWSSPDNVQLVPQTFNRLSSAALVANDDWDTPPIVNTPVVVISGGTVDAIAEGTDWLIKPQGLVNQYFDYHLESDGYVSPPSRVTIVALPTDSAPVAMADELRMFDHENALTIDLVELLANDLGDGVEFGGLTSVPDIATAQLRVLNERLEITPAQDFIGEFTFAYEIYDRNGVYSREPGVVTVRVRDRKGTIHAAIRVHQ